jgi:hypothetical protein
MHVSFSYDSLSLLIFSINSSPKQCRRLLGEEGSKPPFSQFLLPLLALLRLEGFLFLSELFQWMLKSHGH